MVTQKQIETFTQQAYLRNAAVFADSQVISDGIGERVQSILQPEIWANAVANCPLSGDETAKVEVFLQEMKAKKINLGWQLWPDTAPEIIEVLEGKMPSGETWECVYAKSEAIVKSVPVKHRITLLDESTVVGYVGAQRKAWGNSAAVAPLLLGIAKLRLVDKQQTILICQNSAGEILGAAAALHKDDWAYLKGDFVIPSHRRQGIHRCLIAARNKHLDSLGVRHQVALTDQNTSASLYVKLGFQSTHRVKFRTLRNSEWVSL